MLTQIADLHFFIYSLLCFVLSTISSLYTTPLPAPTPAQYSPLSPLSGSFSMPPPFPHNDGFSRSPSLAPSPSPSDFKPGLSSKRQRTSSDGAWSAPIQNEFGEDLCKLFVACNWSNTVANPELELFFARWLPAAILPDCRVLSGRILDGELNKVIAQTRAKIEGKLAMYCEDGWKNVAHTNIDTSLLSIKGQDAIVKKTLHTSLEKRWVAADQELMILAIFFDPDVEFLNSFHRYYDRDGDFTDEVMWLSDCAHMFKGANRPVDLVWIWKQQEGTSFTGQKRAFSIFGLTHTKHRNRLDPQKVHDATFVRMDRQKAHITVSLVPECKSRHFSIVNDEEPNTDPLDFDAMADALISLVKKEVNGDEDLWGRRQVTLRFSEYGQWGLDTEEEALANGDGLDGVLEPPEDDVGSRRGSQDGLVMKKTESRPDLEVRSKRSLIDALLTDPVRQADLGLGPNWVVSVCLSTRGVTCFTFGQHANTAQIILLHGTQMWRKYCTNIEFAQDLRSICAPRKQGFAPSAIRASLPNFGPGVRSTVWSSKNLEPLKTTKKQGRWKLFLRGLAWLGSKRRTCTLHVPIGLSICSMVARIPYRRTVTLLEDWDHRKLALWDPADFPENPGWLTKDQEMQCLLICLFRVEAAHNASISILLPPCRYFKEWLLPVLLQLEEDRPPLQHVTETKRLIGRWLTAYQLLVLSREGECCLLLMERGAGDGVGKTETTIERNQDQLGMDDFLADDEAPTVEMVVLPERSPSQFGMVPVQIRTGSLFPHAETISRDKIQQWSAKSMEVTPGYQPYDDLPWNRSWLAHGKLVCPTCSALKLKSLVALHDDVKGITDLLEAAICFGIPFSIFVKRSTVREYRDVLISPLTLKTAGAIYEPGFQDISLEWSRTLQVSEFDKGVSRLFAGPEGEEFWTTDQITLSERNSLLGHISGNSQDSNRTLWPPLEIFEANCSHMRGYLSVGALKILNGLRDEYFNDPLNLHWRFKNMEPTFIPDKEHWAEGQDLFSTAYPKSWEIIDLVDVQIPEAYEPKL
ncbi:hypothetical protein K438DRAFT_1929389 [Mycena galopus ATCC 62051]|nr:hypothetical protein K438DRAFT_1929389 [Mycena galopus ATCC 62051]